MITFDAPFVLALAPLVGGAVWFGAALPMYQDIWSPSMTIRRRATTGLGVSEPPPSWRVSCQFPSNALSAFLASSLSSPLPTLAPNNTVHRATADEWNSLMIEPP